MRRALMYLAFFSIFFPLLFAFNYYVLWRLFGLVGLPIDLWFWVFVLLSALSFVFAMGVHSRVYHFISKFYYLVASTWLGFLIYLLFVLITYDVLNIAFGLPGWVAMPGILVITLAMVIVALAVPLFIRTRTLTIASSKVERELRVVHLSDIHYGTLNGEGYLRRLVRIVNGLRPDLILITGDLADVPLGGAGNPFSPLDDFAAPAFFTTGNHEYYAGIEDVASLVSKTKVRMLRNESAVSNGVQIAGLDDCNEKEAREALGKIDIDRSKFSIVMNHRPEGLECASEKGASLMLSGHTHGGQTFPFNILAKIVWRRYKGLYEHNGTRLYVTSGSGTWGPPMRLGTFSEVALLRIVPSK